MLKKILSLILSGILLLQSSCFFTFAESVEEELGDKPYDMCDGYPKNDYQQTTSLHCALLQLSQEQKSSNGKSAGVAEHVGPTGKNEIRIWNYDQILGLYESFKQWIQESSKNSKKHEFIGDLIEGVSGFFSLNSTNSTALATEMVKDLVEGQKYFKDLKITSSDLDGWKKIYDKKQSTQHTYWEEFGIRGLNPFNYFKYTKMLKDRAKEEYEKAEELKRIAKVYYSAFEQIVDLVVHQKAHKGKDSLIAVLNFEKDTYKAQVYFTDLGIGVKLDVNPFKKVDGFLENYAGSEYYDNNDDIDNIDNIDNMEDL